LSLPLATNPSTEARTVSPTFSLAASGDSKNITRNKLPLGSSGESAGLFWAIVQAGISATSMSQQNRFIFRTLVHLLIAKHSTKESPVVIPDCHAQTNLTCETHAGGGMRSKVAQLPDFLAKLAIRKFVTRLQ
jgi:hypothetical protein